MHHQPLQINCNESQQQFFLDLGPRSDSILHASGSDCNISCEPCVMRHRDGTAKHDDDPDCHVPQRTFAPEARRAPAKLRHHLLASAWHNFTTCFIKLMYRRIRGCTPSDAPSSPRDRARCSCRRLRCASLSGPRIQNAAAQVKKGTPRAQIGVGECVHVRFEERAPPMLAHATDQPAPGLFACGALSRHRPREKLYHDTLQLCA